MMYSWFLELVSGHLSRGHFAIFMVPGTREQPSLRDHSATMRIKFIKTDEQNLFKYDFSDVIVI